MSEELVYGTVDVSDPTNNAGDVMDEPSDEKEDKDREIRERDDEDDSQR